LRRGCAPPLAHVLTHIGTIEGFGSIIRFVELGDLQARFVEPIDGTAMAHLERGLYEAHARDESGFEEEGGHQQMWYLVRDLALDNPQVGDPLALTMKAMAADGEGGEVIPESDDAIGLHCVGHEHEHAVGVAGRDLREDQAQAGGERRLGHHLDRRLATRLPLLRL